MNTYQEATMSGSRWAGRFAWLVAFLIPFNVYVVPQSGRDVRFTDVLGILLWLAIPTWFAVSKRLDGRSLAKLGCVLVMIVPWLLSDWAEQDLLGSILPLRWILALPLGYLLYRVSLNTHLRAHLIRGLFWGACANVVVLLGQALGYEGVIQTLGLTAPEGVTSASPDATRITGMHGHPNATAATISLCVPLAIAVIDEGIGKTRYLLYSGAALFAGTALTLTRSAGAVAGLTLLLWISGLGVAVNKKMKRWIVGLVLLGVVVVAGPPGGSIRWNDAENIQSNAVVRFNTIEASWELTLANPFGVGSDYQQPLAQSTLFGVTHNAYLQLALLGGIPLAIFVIVLMAKHAFSLLRLPRAESWLAIHVLMLFFFEEHFYNPVFVVLAVWLVAAPTRPQESIVEATATAVPAPASTSVARRV